MLVPAEEVFPCCLATASRRITGENLLAVLRSTWCRGRPGWPPRSRDVFLHHRLRSSFPGASRPCPPSTVSSRRSGTCMARPCWPRVDAYAERPADLRDLDRRREGAAPSFTPPTRPSAGCLRGPLRRHDRRAAGADPVFQGAQGSATCT
ncbi:hypothetical protein QJS66_14775 [Kocuria rhizophila]|nr:hypothetical protein QJS66_14775 [Kocuria rhizophila]